MIDVLRAGWADRHPVRARRFSRDDAGRVRPRLRPAFVSLPMVAGLANGIIGLLTASRWRTPGERIVNESVAGGAELLASGSSDGLRYRPTVLSGVSANMPVVSEEVFGPVTPVTVVEDENEAVRVAKAPSLACPPRCRPVTRDADVLWPIGWKWAWHTSTTRPSETTPACPSAARKAAGNGS